MRYRTRRRQDSGLRRIDMGKKRNKKSIHYIWCWNKHNDILQIKNFSLITYMFWFETTLMSADLTVHNPASYKFLRRLPSDLPRCCINPILINILWFSIQSKNHNLDIKKVALTSEKILNSEIQGENSSILVALTHSTIIKKYVAWKC